MRLELRAASHNLQVDFCCNLTPCQGAVRLPGELTAGCGTQVAASGLELRSGSLRRGWWFGAVTVPKTASFLCSRCSASPRVVMGFSARVLKFPLLGADPASVW